MASARIKVKCLECGRRFMTAQVCPLCPRCGGAGVEPVEVAVVPATRAA